MPDQTPESSNPIKPSFRGWIAFALPLCLWLGLALPGCLPGHQAGSLPGASTPSYGDMVTAFYTGLAALEGGGTIKLESGETISAEAQFQKATQLAPDEPAAWANLGLVELRQSQMDKAAQDLNKAQSLAPNSAEIEALLGLLYQQQGQFDQEVEHLTNAVKQSPSDLRTRYALKYALEQQAGGHPNAKVGAALDEMLKLQPDSLALLIEQARVTAALGDKKAMADAVTRISKFAGTWPPDAVEELHKLQAEARGANLGQAATQATMLGNVLKQVTNYKQSLATLQPSTTQVGEPIEHFIKLPTPSASPAPPDMAVTFTSSSLPGAAGAKWDVVRAVWLMPNGRPATAPPGVSAAPSAKPVLLAANSKEVRRVDGSGLSLPFPGGAQPAGPDGILALDWNWDAKTDLVLAGAGGVRLYQQVAGGKFNDVTSRSGLNATTTSTPLYGAWAADYDADSDLDIVLGTRSGPPIVLRNNRDGTFKAITPFAGVSGMRAFAWGDLDGDGDADAALIDAQGTLHVFTNERSGLFKERAVPSALGKAAAVTVADINGDGLLDLVVLQQDGAIKRLSSKDDASDWEVADLAKWDNPPSGLADGAAQVFVQDLDNNAGFDIVASCPAKPGTTGAKLTRIWMVDAAGKYAPLPAAVDADVTAIADFNSDSRLDLAGINADGQPVELLNKGTKNYNWIDLRPLAGLVVDKRIDPSDPQAINSYGIGGEIGLRAALIYQKQPITGPVLHYGLGNLPGDASQMTVARVVWPNGAAQAEFKLKRDTPLLFVQRLQTSCPYLFAWDGHQMGFITDCIWRSPLGLKINAQDTAGVMQTEDWLKIRGDQLVPRNGFYDLRITAELWETHFFDYLDLMTVDHPAGTDIWVDERMAFPQPPLKVYVTRPAQPFRHVTDDRGADVTETVRARDGNYLAGFGRSQFRGVTRDHWVEAELGPEVPRDKPLWLIANGWIRPTNSSINVALGQGHHTPPQGLVLEVPDANGHWSVAKPGLGFPEGKVKTILISLDGVFKPGAPRRFRLRTNLEIFWDSLAWAEGLPQGPLQQQRLKLASADLHYRGFSELAAKDDTSPDLPVSYDKLGGTTQRWRDLTGYYTRFGEVRPLLAKTDDRYVIMNAGDEMSLRFPAAPPPQAGWVRDYVLIGDGWVKDGDYNTTFSKTVLPLPAHNRADYPTPPTRLWDDPVYQAHRQDWRDYHTRYVTPFEFQESMVPRAKRAEPF